MEQFKVTWLEQTLDVLSEQPAIGYAAGTAPAAEPTAIAALALAANARIADAKKAADALIALQQPNGAVSVRAGENSPGWPTSLAVAAWCAVGNALRGVPPSSRGVVNALRGVPPADTTTSTPEFADHIARGIAWLLANRGQGMPRAAEFGHNSELVGWAFAEHTHSWVEPTSFAVLALKAAGKADDPATREGIAVLIDRQLPGGGLNYGNTTVLGQRLRAHMQPTGIALLALAGETDSSNRLAKTIAWLARSIGPETTPQSLAWASLGLKAHGEAPPAADEWLAAAAERVVTLRVPSSGDGTRSVPTTFKLALLALAAQGWPA
jgi:hypothetical protein